MVIKIENNKPVGYPLMEDNFKQLFPSVTFPRILFPADVEPYGYGMYEFSQRPSNLTHYEKLVEGDPIKDANGYWRQNWVKVEQTVEEKTETDIARTEFIRKERNLRLALTDWTQLQDVPLSDAQKTAWVKYRQDLRDVSFQVGFPWEITWPAQPFPNV
jgi:hypothetical protein